MAEQSKPFVELQSRSTENVTPEGRRFNEVQSVAATILNQRAEQVWGQMEKDNRGPQTDQEKAYYFFHALRNLPPKPEPGSGTPEPHNEAPEGGKPLKIRLIEKTVSGKRAWQVAPNQEGTGGYTVEIKALQYKDGDMICFTGERTSKSGARVKVNYAIPAQDLMLGQLNSESDAILNDTGLTTEQVDMLKLSQESFKHGMDPIRDTKTVDTIAEGARASGLLTRSSLEKFISARGVSIPQEKLDRMFGTDSVIQPHTVVEVFDAAGFFDKNQLKVMSQDAERAFGTAQAAMKTAETKVQQYKVFEGKAVGDKIPGDNGSEIEVTQADIDNVTTAQNELIAAQKAAEEALQELKELKAAESQAADPRIRGELEKYMKRVQSGDIDAASGLAFVRAVESNDPEGIFKAVMEEELKKIEDEKARDAKRKELQAKYQKYNARALQVGGIALMVLLMMMKDSMK